MAAITKNYSIRQFLDVYLECLLLSQSISKGTEIRRGRILRSCKKSLNKESDVSIISAFTIRRQSSPVEI